MPTLAEEAELVAELARVKEQRASQQAAFEAEKENIAKIAHKRGDMNSIGRGLDRLLKRHGLTPRAETTRPLVAWELRQRLTYDQFRATRTLPGMERLAGQPRERIPIASRFSPSASPTGEYDCWIAMHTVFTMPRQPIGEECVCGQPYEVTQETKNHVFGYGTNAYESYFAGVEIARVVYSRCFNKQCEFYEEDDDDE